MSLKRYHVFFEMDPKTLLDKGSQQFASDNVTFERHRSTEQKNFFKKVQATERKAPHKVKSPGEKTWRLRGTEDMKLRAWIVILVLRLRGQSVVTSAVGRFYGDCARQSLDRCLPS